MTAELAGGLVADWIGVSSPFVALLGVVIFYQRKIGRGDLVPRQTVDLIVTVLEARLDDAHEQRDDALSVAAEERKVSEANAEAIEQIATSQQTILTIVQAMPRPHEASGREAPQ